ncbi:MAG: hypothetical protein IJ043_05115 [Clostridia bacterium]|nr:hypothetical protein [Clostridia bacterium]
MMKGSKHLYFLLAIPVYLICDYAACYKVGLALVCLLELLLIGAGLILLKSQRLNKAAPICLGGGVVVFTVCLQQSLDYTFLQSGLVFWKSSLAFAGLAAGVFLLPALWKKRYGWKSAATLALVTAVCTFLVSWVLLQHINYLFDPSEPQVYAEEILDKDHHHGRRKISRYLLEVEWQGETLSFSVSSEAYRLAEEGDTLVFWYYEGALEEPYCRWARVETK